MKQSKPSPLSWHELQLAVMSVVEQLVPLLSLFKSFTDLHQELIPVSQLAIHSW
jgi:hypothetical protein